MKNTTIRESDGSITIRHAQGKTNILVSASTLQDFAHIRGMTTEQAITVLEVLFSSVTFRRFPYHEKER